MRWSRCSVIWGTASRCRDCRQCRSGAARGSRRFAGCRLELAPAANAFLAGESMHLLALLFERLLESASARREAAQVELQLRMLDDFARKDIAALRRALQTVGRSGWVPGEERDALFIAARHG